MGFQYKVVPFIGHAKGRLYAADVAKQLEATIQQHVSQGWEFYQLSDINIEVRPGCVAGLFGAKLEYARFDQLIFRADEGAALATATDVASTYERDADRHSPRPVEAGGWRCSCGQINTLDAARCFECRKWRSFSKS